MRKTDVKLKNRKGEEVTYSDIKTILIDEKTFTYGTVGETVVDLDFSEGEQVIYSPDTVSYEKLTINVPETMVPENIAEGVTIAGIKGTFEGAREMPVLYPPSISRSGDVINISNPGNNGAYNKSFNIYSDGELLENLTQTSFNVTTTFESENDYSFQVTCNNPLMQESEKSNTIKISNYSVIKELGDHLTGDNINAITDGMSYALSMKREDGYWFPESITVLKKKNGGEYEVTDNYEYSMYSGSVVLNNINSNIKIIAEADEEPILKRPDLEIDSAENTLTYSFPKYAQHVYILDCGEPMYEEKENTDFKVTTEKLGTTYTFVEQSDGYYSPTNTGVHNSFAIIRIAIENNTGEEKTMDLDWMQNSESGCDFGLVGKIDTALALSNTIDSTVTFSAVSKSATTAQTLKLTCPVGSHFYDVKYRKDQSVNNGWDMFRFSITAMGVASMADDSLSIEQGYHLSISNKTYESLKSANVTHHITMDDETELTVKEGV